MTMKTVLGSIHRISTRSIYDVLLKNELGINENAHLRIEFVYEDFSLRNILGFRRSKLISTTIRSHMWKIIHRIEFSEIEEAKVKLISPSCKICGEGDIDRIHHYFRCEKVVNISIIFLRVLRIFDPLYTLEEILEFKAKEEHPQLYWFIALTLYYIDKNRKRCSTDLYRAYMWTELEVLRKSKCENEEMIQAINIMLELLEE